MKIQRSFFAFAALLGYRFAAAQLTDNPSLPAAAPTAGAASAPPSGKAPYGGVVRNYFIQINEYEWSYLPSGMDLFHGGPPSKTPAAKWFAKSSKTIGSRNIKALYRAYTDKSFSTPVPHEPWLGTLGPVIRGEVGDQIRVLLSNQASFNFSMHPHGVQYTVTNEGAVYQGAALGAMVAPGSKYEYVWNVPPRAGPGPNDGPSILWGYHSHVLDAADIFAGLTGAIIIYNKGLLGANGLPKIYDHEYVLQLLVFDENQSPYLQRNVKASGVNPSVVDTPDFVESNMKHTINGFAFNNLPGITMKVGDRVRLHLMGFGNEDDIHALSFHGNTAIYDNHRVDTMELLPAVFRSLDMVPDNPGQWMMQCETTDHTLGGMIASYQVLPGKAKPSSGGRKHKTSTAKKPKTTYK